MKRKGIFPCPALFFVEKEGIVCYHIRKEALAERDAGTMETTGRYCDEIFISQRAGKSPDVQL